MTRKEHTEGFCGAKLFFPDQGSGEMGVRFIIIH